MINFPFSVALIEREVTMTQPFSTFPYLIHQENIPNQAEGYPYIYICMYIMIFFVRTNLNLGEMPSLSSTEGQGSLFSK